MKFVISTGFISLLALGAAQQTSVPSKSSLVPTPLEAFAASPETRVASSTEVGRLESSAAHGVVTAIMLEDSAQPPDRLRGVRVDLRADDAKDTVYLGEETLATYKRAMDEITRGTPDWRKTYAQSVAPGGTSYFGAEVFWYADKKPRVHVLSAAQCDAGNWSGLSVNTFTGTEFRFPGREAADLSALFARAIDTLNPK